MSWIIVTEDQRKAQKEAANEQFRRMMEEARRKQEARDIHEKTRCPHCGRIDPLPPWLY